MGLCCLQWHSGTTNGNGTTDGSAMALTQPTAHGAADGSGAALSNEPRQWHSRRLGCQRWLWNRRRRREGGTHPSAIPLSIAGVTTRIFKRGRNLRSEQEVHTHHSAIDLSGEMPSRVPRLQLGDLNPKWPQPILNLGAQLQQDFRLQLLPVNFDALVEPRHLCHALRRSLRHARRLGGQRWGRGRRRNLDVAAR